jgi:hypothetical protein
MAAAFALANLDMSDHPAAIEERSQRDELAVLSGLGSAIHF